MSKIRCQQCRCQLEQIHFLAGQQWCEFCIADEKTRKGEPAVKETTTSFAEKFIKALNA
jgi:hypothetical protein